MRRLLALTLLLAGCGQSAVSDPLPPCCVPAPTYTPAPSAVRYYEGLGDSITAGYSATPLSLGFEYLTYGRLNAWFPGMVNFNDGHVGYTSTDIAHYLTGILPALDKFSYVTIEVGINNLRGGNGGVVGGVTEISSAYGSSLSAGTSISFVFKNEYQTGIINPILGSCVAPYKVVLVNIFDPTQGTGVGGDSGIFTAWPNYLGVAAQFNLRIQELASENGFYLANVHDFMMGHPEWITGGLHPTNDGHIAMADVITKFF